MTDSFTDTAPKKGREEDLTPYLQMIRKEVLAFIYNDVLKGPVQILPVHQKLQDCIIAFFHRIEVLQAAGQFGEQAINGVHSDIGMIGREFCADMFHQETVKAQQQYGSVILQPLCFLNCHNGFTGSGSTCNQSMAICHLAYDMNGPFRRVGHVELLVLIHKFS